MRLFVKGTPRPQGSKRHIGNGVMIEQSKHVKPWRQQIKAEASQVAELTDKAVAVNLRFQFARPKSHYGTGRNAAHLKAGKSGQHIQRPDTDKLSRAVLDALTGVAFVDDSQVVTLNAHKTWVPRGLESGVEITVEVKQ